MRTCFTSVRLKGTLPVSPQIEIAWFEVLAHNTEALHSGRTRSFVLRALALFTEDGLMRDSELTTPFSQTCLPGGVTQTETG